MGVHLTRGSAPAVPVRRLQGSRLYLSEDSMSTAPQWLAQNGKGTNARLHSKFKGPQRDMSFLMMWRLFDAVVLRYVYIGFKVCTPACSRNLAPDLKNMLDIQV